jgi:hypothetical protein
MDLIRRHRLFGHLALSCTAIIGCATLSAEAQQPTQAQLSAIRSSCRGDYMTHCSSVPTGGAAALQCLQQHAAQTSAGCQQALRAVSPPRQATAPAAAATAPAKSVPTEAVWPHTVTGERGSAVIYQPQIISWPDRRTLNARIALGITPVGAKSATLGAIEVAFATQSDLATRTVTLSAPKLQAAHFPSADPQQVAQFEERIKSALDSMGEKRVPLDTILMSLNRQQETPPAVALNNDPPKIFYSARPASLLVFDGDPVLAPVTGTSLSAAVNTNWDVFVDNGTKTWYWLNNGAWLTASDVKGPWAPVTTLPAAFSSLPADENFAAVRKQIPGRRMSAAEVPTIFVSTLPAEIIVTTGPPNLVAIAGTSLKYASNTDVNLFVDSKTGHYYYLVSGRWFSAPTLDGPWTFATASLPADFARIPPNSPRGSVLVSVPGTPQAQEALLQAQVPTEAALDRSTAKLDVVYTGPPKFEPIPGTGMTYAVNTPNEVIYTGEKYYACYQAAWFVAASPTGAWVLADSVPAVIYTIPPSSPLYRCTYVRVYGATPTTVTYGYTAGYTMGYIAAGVVVYGTGYYYPPVIWPGPIPIYYPYPYSYSGATWYNTSTGAWARGGTIYGPYGGAVSGGTAYNPNTGAWAHGGAIYGPNGGAGAWSAYNPSTGSYAHGSASWGTNSGTANANWYNARTGITGSTNQNYNQYGSWGSSTFSGANKTVTTQHQSNAQGTAGSFQSSTGAQGAGVKGAGGNSAGVAKTASGDVYAGADGNVYKKTSDGWSKYNDGSWTPVQPPTNSKSNAQQNLSGQTRQSSEQNLSGQTRQSSQQNLSGETRQSSQQNLSGATERGSAFRQGSSAEAAGGFRQGGFGGGEFQQLENDRGARTMGAQRQAQFSRGGGGGGGFERGGGFAGGGRRR